MYTVKKLAIFSSPEGERKGQKHLLCALLCIVLHQTSILFQALRSSPSGL
jgi:hypothetical protein